MFRQAAEAAVVEDYDDYYGDDDYDAEEVKETLKYVPVFGSIQASEDLKIILYFYSLIHIL